MDSTLMSARVRIQLREACGPVNRWFCSKAIGHSVDDPQSLLIYFIRNGGAADFARRFAEAMAPENRWYCSEFYHREIRDPGILWDYYMSYFKSRASIAC